MPIGRKRVGGEQQCDREPGAQHDPGAAVRRDEGPGRDRHGHHRPSRVAQLDVPRPMHFGFDRRLGGKIGRVAAQARCMDVQRRIRAPGIGGEQIDVDTLRSRVGGENFRHHLPDQERAVDEPGEVAASVVDRLVHMTLAIDGQREQDAARRAIGAVKHPVGNAGQLVEVTRTIELVGDRRAQVEAVEPIGLRQGRIEDRQIFVALRRRHDRAVTGRVPDAIGGDTVVLRGTLVRGTLGVEHAGNPIEILDRIQAAQHALGEQLEFHTGDRNPRIRTSPATRPACSNTRSSRSAGSADGFPRPR